MTQQQARTLLLDLARGFREILGPALVGVYLHGSLAMDAFTPGSDIDFLAVSARPLTREEKAALLALLWESRGRWPEKGVEMSIVTREAAAAPALDCPYELHFSPGWFARYAAGPAALCGPEIKTDRDLPAHFTVARLRGAAVLPHTPPPEEVFTPVPWETYLASVWHDLYPYEAVCKSDPAAAVLNFCRTLAFGAQARVFSKAEGGRWAVSTPGALAESEAATAAAALAAYESGGRLPEEDALAFCARVLPRLPRNLPRPVKTAAPPTLRTPRLTLRRFTPEDAPAMYAGWANSENVCRWLLMTPGRTLAQCREYLTEVAASYTLREGFHQWAICENTAPAQNGGAEAGPAVGSVALYVNSSQRSASVAYLLAEKAHGRGIMSEALSAVVRFGFNTLGLHRIEGDHFIENPASGRVMEKAGMRREGIARGKYYKYGCFHDAVLLAAIAPGAEGGHGFSGGECER